MRCPRILLAAGASHSGKTTITCGLLQAFKNRGQDVASFKCGPDYIDPMFHRRVIGARSANLDPYFAGKNTLRTILARKAVGCDISIMEGVMGYYDGLGGVTTRASSYELAGLTQTPVVFIVDCKGMSLSIVAHIKGYLEYKKDSRIKGVILNRISSRLYPAVRAQIEKELGIAVLGYVPPVKDIHIDSRHLGLMMPGEVEALERKIKAFASLLQDTIDLDGLEALANSASDLEDKPVTVPALDGTVRIAVARDDAFCFIYEENLDILRAMGAELVEFSPLTDRELPQGISGLLLPGGYPENYARQLSENRAMLEAVRQAVDAGMPCIAECGGFLYLHQTLEDMEGVAYPMVGALDAQAMKTARLGNFGYVELITGTKKIFDDQVGNIKAHEYHYFASTDEGTAFTARKPVGKKQWPCIHYTDTLLAGFPHIYYYSNLKFPLAFLKKCQQYDQRQGAKIKGSEIRYTEVGHRSQSTDSGGNTYEAQ